MSAQDSVRATRAGSVDDLIDSDTPGVHLHLRGKRPPSASPARRPLVVVHGATFSSGSLFDVPFDGVSVLDALARAGASVHALDVRGYGGSSRPSSMDADPAGAAPEAGTAVGVRDLRTAVDWVLDHTGAGQVDLLGMSWGATVTAAYAAGQADRVGRLALVAPQWLDDGPIPLDPGGPIGSHRPVAVADFEQRWLGAVPTEHRAALIPAGWFEQWAQATLDEEPDDGHRAAGRIRAVNGPIQDVRDFWAAGRPFYDPQAVQPPTLMVHGEWDHDVPIGVALELFRRLGAPEKRMVALGRATHMLLLEADRMLAVREINDFLSR